MKTEVIQSAFPVTNPETVMYNSGLSKREYFAALAMQGILATVDKVSPSNALEFPTNVAQWSVLCADALIVELNKESK